MSRDPYVVMAKPAGPRCNLACSYCYYLASEALYPAGDDCRMSAEMLETYIRQYIEDSPGPIVSFIWHGGEPTLAGLKFFQLAVQLQKKYLPAGWSCWNNLQTNGILLDDAWCSFLAQEHFDVGLSLDGTSALHDTCRLDRGGHGSYLRVRAALQRLQAHGIQPDLLCTVTAGIAREPVAVYQALRDLKTGWIQFIPIVRRDTGGQVTEDSVSAETYGRFLCAVYNEWIQNDIGQLEVQLFAETALVWAGGQASVCWMAPTCGRVLVLEHDGSVYSCDHFVNSSHRIGSLAGQRLGSLVDSPVQRTFGKNKRYMLPDQCLQCPWLSVCNGGCPKDRFIADANGQPGLNYLCAGFQLFYTHAEKSLRLIGQLRQQGTQPDVIQSKLRLAALERWQGIGRNDPCLCGSGRKAKNCCWSRRDLL
jgi:uncharacterized protein